jgi:hypothetical protein
MSTRNQQHPPGPPMDLANMREQGVTLMSGGPGIRENSRRAQGRHSPGAGAATPVPSWPTAASMYFQQPIWIRCCDNATMNIKKLRDAAGG